MSNRNNNQSLQNDSGQLNLVVRDEGTSNIYAHTKTLRFEPEGCLTFGPSGREVTINTASTGGTGGGVVPADVLWEVGTSGTSSIRAKNSGTIDATGDYSVAHGFNNTVSGNKGYVAGGSGNSSTHENSVILGGTSLSSAATNTTYIGKELEVGQASAIGSIKRVSATALNSWEDGNCGNSKQLWFTPTEFVGYDIAGAVPAALAISDARLTAWSAINSGAPFGAVLYDAFEEGQLVAMKLLPKGFTTGESGATFYFAGVPSWVSTLDVYGNDLTTNTYSLLGSIAPTLATQTVPFGGAVTGTGPMTIMVVINQGGAIRPNQSLMGVSVDLFRV